MSKELVLSFDVEGPIINPSFDFAWLTIGRLLGGLISKAMNEKIRIFDEYDDNRWLRERLNKGHSTGTTPIIASLLAVSYGVKNDSLLKLAKNNLSLTPGATELITWLKREKGIEPYFISSAHPAAILPVAYKLGILSSHVFCHGKQLDQKDGERFNEERKKRPEDYDRIIQTEVQTRFPYEKYAKSGILSRFLDSYLENCAELNSIYKEDIISDSKLASLKERQIQLLDSVKDEDNALASDIGYLLYSEEGVMGAHRKKHALELIEEREKSKKKNLIYIGDSIVDADPIAYVSLGMSVNCTDKNALLASRINLATPTICSLIPVIDSLLSGQALSAKSARAFEKRLNENTSAEEGRPATRIFTAREIDEDLNSVIQANRLCKDYVKNKSP